MSVYVCFLLNTCAVGVSVDCVCCELTVNTKSAHEKIMSMFWNSAKGVLIEDGRMDETAVDVGLRPLPAAHS